VIQVKEFYAELIDLRRHFHKYPETANEEYETSAYLKNYLAACGLEVYSGLAETGVIGVLNGGAGGPTIGLRSDMDALPINEENDVSYKSYNPGIMHACGHDGHMAVTLITAKILSMIREQIKGTIVFIFQPAEENLPEGGAKRLLNEGKRFFRGMDAIFGFHFWPFLETGTIALSENPIMAAGDVFEVSFKGQGAHGANPHQSTDVLMMACNAVLSLTSIVSRNIEPGTSATLSVGAIEGGKSPNVLPTDVSIKGTSRYTNPEFGSILPKKIENVLAGISSAYNGSYELNYKYGYPVLENDKKMVELVKKIILSMPEQTAVMEVPKPSLTSEDFAAYLHEIPGCYFWLGTQSSRQGVINSLHNPQYDLDENAMVTAVETLLSIVQHFVLKK